MNIEYIDHVLSYLVGKDGTVFSQEITSEKELQGDLMAALNKLEKDGYCITYRYRPLPPKPPFWEVKITPEGKMFHNQGGYSTNELLRLSPIRSENLARFAVWVAIIATIIALVALLVTLNIIRVSPSQH